MTDCAGLQREIDRLDAIQSQINAATNGIDQARKLEVVQLRRQLSERIGRVNTIGQQLVGLPE
jgi:hypothetical protein